MRTPHIVTILFTVVVALSGCGKKTPAGLISQRDMEALLYDYHIAQVVSNEAPAYRRDAYLEYVFRKHGITQAEFDSSMVWYTRHGDQLAEIYANVAKRLEREEEYMKMLADRAGSQIAVSLSGDTVDVWQDRTVCWLSPSPLTNRLTFDLKADTTFRPYDKMEFAAQFSFVPQATPAEDSRAVVGLLFQFENDSVQGIVRTIHAPGSHSVTLQADSAFQPKSVGGFVYYAQSDPTVPGGVIIDNIRFIRYHDDGTAALRDSIAAAERAQKALEAEEETEKTKEPAATKAKEKKASSASKNSGSKSGSKESKTKASGSKNKSKTTGNKQKSTGSKTKSSQTKSSQSKSSQSKSAGSKTTSPTQSKTKAAGSSTETVKTKAADVSQEALEDAKAKAAEIDPATIEEMRAKAQEAAGKGQ